MNLRRYYKLTYTYQNPSGIRRQRTKDYAIGHYDTAVARYNFMQRNRAAYPVAALYEVTRLA